MDRNFALAEENLAISRTQAERLARTLELEETKSMLKIKLLQLELDRKLAGQN
jgi:hypothetical protein